MKKQAVYPALCAASVCVFLLSSGLTYASWREQGDTVNKITMASVKGQIVEQYEQDPVLYPNGTADKIVQVKNTGTADALPRVKIEKAWGDGRDENGRLLIDPELSTDNIEITYNTEHWTYNEEDGYFYYKEVLKPGDTTVSLFDSFTINGENTGGEYKNKLADIIVNMEMVQAAGGGLSYWNTSFEELGITYVRSDLPVITTEVDFNGPGSGFSFDVNEGDLFADFKDLVPGESRSQTVEITNNWDESAEIFLWADFIDQSHATEETRELIYDLLHEYANIVITDDGGDLIYEGPVWGNPDVDSEGTDSMKYPYSLGIFEGGGQKSLNVSLSLDPQMDNEYRELLGLIKWVFSAEGGEDDSSVPDSSVPDSSDSVSPPDSSGGGKPPSGSAAPPTTASRTSDTPVPTNPSTGSPLKTGAFGMTALAALLAIPITYKKSKQNTKK